MIDQQLVLPTELVLRETCTGKNIIVPQKNGVQHMPAEETGEPPGTREQSSAKQ
jgi:hypothetical protein